MIFSSSDRSSCSFASFSASLFSFVASFSFAVSLAAAEKDFNLNALSVHGVKTIYDLHDLNEAELMKIDGIGYVSAEAIIAGIEKVKKSVLKDVRPKIDPDSLNEHTLKLLEVIYEKLVKLDEYKQLAEEIKAFQVGRNNRYC